MARFGPWKIAKCLENGPFWNQQWVKNGSKTRFSKNDPGPSMMLKQVVLAHFDPVATGFGSWKLPKCLENGPFWDQKWVKNGSNTRFSKSDPGPFGMLKQERITENYRPLLFGVCIPYGTSATIVQQCTIHTDGFVSQKNPMKTSFTPASLCFCGASPTETEPSHCSFLQTLH